MRHLLLLSLALGFAACGDSNNKTVDAAVPVDMAVSTVALDCPTYCNQIMTNCTGDNAQYADMAHCLGSCAAFVVGTSKVTDTSGDTLGCRIYHSGAPAVSDAALHCPHAGPGGDKLNVGTPGFCSGGDLCADFCALNIKTCGSMDAPVMIGTTAITPQYKNQAQCEMVCKNGDAAASVAAFDLTHVYSPKSAGNSLACRLNHWTNAAANAAITPPTADSIKAVNAHCSHEAAVQAMGMPCFATPPTP